MTEREEWNIHDSTKIKEFLTCPRKYFYRYVLGWREDMPQHDLHFGGAVHKALESIYEEWKQGDKSYSDNQLERAYEEFLADYRQYFLPHTDLDFDPKTPGNFRLMLQRYAQTYRLVDRFDVIQTEISGCVPVGQNPDGSEKLIYFLLDAVCKDKDGYFILEHKTSKWGTELWKATWSLSTQVGTGCHIMKCLYGDEAWGMRINGMLFRKPPAMKKDGTPRANASAGNECVRVPIRLSIDRQEDWMRTTERHLDSIKQEFDVLAEEVNKGQRVMRSFPKNPEGCLKYNRKCPYYDFCISWTNPLHRCHQIQPGFVEEHWDPRNKDKAYKGMEG